MQQKASPKDPCFAGGHSTGSISCHRRRRRRRDRICYDYAYGRESLIHHVRRPLAARPPWTVF